MTQDLSFDDACSLIEPALAGTARQQQIADLSTSKSLAKALARLREFMRANTYDRFVGRFDHRTRQEGFHVLHDWDGKADHVLGEMIPVDVLDYVVAQRASAPPDPTVLALLLDYYFFHILQLLALRVWDDGDADAHLDRLSRMLADLQGPGGSGQRFVTNAETLILIATSHFEVVERGYDKLLRRVKTLNRAHQTNVALGHASSMGSHLRFGFEATYGRDTTSMRDDNVADYPWLCFALVTVMREYTRLREARVDGPERAAVVEAVVNGLSPDARAFVGAPPASLSRAEAERAEFRDTFLAYRSDLLAEFERHRPVDGAYSPLSLFFNFSHNVLKGTIVDALLRGDAWPVAFNDLLTGLPAVRLNADTTDEPVRLEADTTCEEPRERLARTLMEYARANPDRIGGRLMPVIVYDPRAGHRAFRIMMEKLAPSP